MPQSTSFQIVPAPTAARNFYQERLQRKLEAQQATIRAYTDQRAIHVEPNTIAITRFSGRPILAIRHLQDNPAIVIFSKVAGILCCPRRYFPALKNFQNLFKDVQVLLYLPQKGVTPEQSANLEAYHARICTIVEHKIGLPVDWTMYYRNIPLKQPQYNTCWDQCLVLDGSGDDWPSMKFGQGIVPKRGRPPMPTDSSTSLYSEAPANAKEAPEELFMKGLEKPLQQPEGSESRDPSPNTQTGGRRTTPGSISDGQQYRRGRTAERDKSGQRERQPSRSSDTTQNSHSRSPEGRYGRQLDRDQYQTTRYVHTSGNPRVKGNTRKEIHSNESTPPPTTERREDRSSPAERRGRSASPARTDSRDDRLQPVHRERTPARDRSDRSWRNIMLGP